MSERPEYGGSYLRVLGIGLGISLLLYLAILGLTQIGAASSRDVHVRPTDDDSRGKLRLALAESEQVEEMELTDVQLVESHEAPATRPAPEAHETSTVEVSLGLEPPELDMSSSGTAVAVSPVERRAEDLGSAIRRPVPQGDPLPVRLGDPSSATGRGPVGRSGAFGTGRDPFGGIGISVGGIGISIGGRGNGPGGFGPRARGCQGRTQIPVPVPIAGAPRSGGVPGPSGIPGPIGGGSTVSTGGALGGLPAGFDLPDQPIPVGTPGTRGRQLRFEPRGENRNSAARKVVSAAVREARQAVTRQTRPAVRRQARPAAVRQARPAVTRQARPAAVRQARPAAVRQAKPAVRRQTRPAAVKRQTRPAAVTRQARPAAPPNQQ